MKIVWVVGLGGGGIALALLISWCVGSERVQAQVTGLHWKHTTDLRKRSERRDGRWGSPPARAGYYREDTWDYSCRDKMHGEHCCGWRKERSSGSGSTQTRHCSSWCPTYDRWCDYSYYEWPIIRSREVSGEGHVTRWETFEEIFHSNFRETHQAKYTVTFANGRRTKTWKYVTSSYRRFKEFEIGDLWALRLPNVGPMEPQSRSSFEKN